MPWNLQTRFKIRRTITNFHMEILSKNHPKNAMKIVLIGLFLCYFLADSSYASSNKIGMNYGRLGNNLPSHYESIQALLSMQAGIVKLYDADHEVLELLSGANIHVSIMVTNKVIGPIAANQSNADTWVSENVIAYYPQTQIRFVLIGNEVLSTNDQKMWLDLVPAMRNIKKSLDAQNIHNIKVGTPLAMDILESTFPPSSGRFRSGTPTQVMKSLLNFLSETSSFFFVDVYPYFPWSANPTNMSLDFALLENKNVTYKDPKSGLLYTNYLDGMLDSIIFAMRRVGFGNIKIAIAETGWPNAGDIDQPGANLYNAATYNRNVVRKMTANPPLGTPARPGVMIPTILFSLYDENQKSGPGTERHWGLMHPSGIPNFEIDLTGRRPVNEYIPIPRPVNNRPYRGKIWCVASSFTRLLELETALDFACQQGNGTCDALAPGRSCYDPVSVVAHASYAFSSYWSKYRSSGGTCYFNGLAVQTTRDPSHGSCRFPSVSLRT